MRDDTRDYRRLFIDDIPLMDVRAPVEFGKGAFPAASNLPLMNDEERQAVGIMYKQQGQDCAIALGQQLVSGERRDARIAAWANFARQHPEGYLYCFRGGLRSQIAQQWLREAGVQYPRVLGGYKSLRNYLIQQIDQALGQCAFVLVGGLTGSGKTALLAELDNSLDLEGLAHHRGSSFGKHATPQPAQIDFENALAVELLKKRARGMRQFALEEEGRTVGSCFLPAALYQNMQHYPLVWLEDSFENRVQRILEDYVIDLAGEFTTLHGQEAGLCLFAQRLRASLAKIIKRLGHENYRRLATLMDDALSVQLRDGGVEHHRAWIEGLLRDYYDPMYTYQRRGKAARIAFSGDRSAVADYLRACAART
ncbi:tRNA 2-selenouridine(34) synthase MnmH [Allopusillimonas ginsengisoli]|uniref:tRNA 2-selenouridine(34) synthase MnmH n=1 Tax=Allopusillimonas ginsengisoli TaxID=453575 RepID=UPI0010226785|nr:tRNA 2-selenouridine(34) synthase MnmH [Allopusillimonas ginsengisoli]TEA76963.1 tRNA 2-selenouridine(34) synthase MnmH [Allopusillimonas ginsengisoli]